MSHATVPIPQPSSVRLRLLVGIASSSTLRAVLPRRGAGPHRTEVRSAAHGTTDARRAASAPALRTRATRAARTADALDNAGLDPRGLWPPSRIQHRKRLDAMWSKAQRRTLPGGSPARSDHEPDRATRGDDAMTDAPPGT